MNSSLKKIMKLPIINYGMTAHSLSKYELDAAKRGDVHTLTHGFHKPYETDWSEAIAKAYEAINKKPVEDAA